MVADGPLAEIQSAVVEVLEEVLDEQLSSTAPNAVERGNRRHRQMEETVYRVRTRRAIEGRPAPDLRRERRVRGRAGTTGALHRARSAWCNKPVPSLQSSKSQVLMKLPSASEIRIRYDRRTLDIP
jgi:hypothetical protein